MLIIYDDSTDKTFIEDIKIVHRINFRNNHHITQRFPDCLIDHLYEM